MFWDCRHHCFDIHNSSHQFIALHYMSHSPIHTLMAEAAMRPAVIYSSTALYPMSHVPTIHNPHLCISKIHVHISVFLIVFVIDGACWYIAMYNPTKMKSHKPTGQSKICCLYRQCMCLYAVYTGSASQMYILQFPARCNEKRYSENHFWHNILLMTVKGLNRQHKTNCIYIVLF